MNTAKISHIKTDTNMMLPKQSFMKLAGWVLACSAFFACAPEEVPRASLIPMPAHVEWLGGSLRVDSLSLFGADPAGSLRCVVDASAEAFDTIIFSAGKIGAQVELAPAALAELVGCTFAPVTKQNR